MSNKVVKTVIFVVLSLGFAQGWQIPWEYPDEMPQLKEYLSSPENGEQAVQSLEYGLEEFQRATRFMSIIANDWTCSSCQEALVPIDAFCNSLTVRAALEEIITEICVHFKISGGEKAVCQGAIDTMANSVMPALAQGIFAPQRVCDEYLHLCTTPKIEEESADAYVKKRLSEKPDIIKSNDFVDKLYTKIKRDPNPRKTVRSIQLSDIHIDFAYREGAPSECDFPICCRDNGPTDAAQLLKNTTSRPAGKWGDYNCDIPYKTMKNMFDFIGSNQDTLKTDFITWVGDNSGHNVWSNTQEEITNYTVNITQSLKDALGPNSTVQVYPIQGNHDTWPVNVQDFSKPGQNWAINHFKDTWKDKNWLSDDEIEVFGQYGYYSKPFPFNQEGKMIAVNMQACNDLNWWLLTDKDRNDPGNQIAWLEAELVELEKKEGFAYVIAHIPSRSCLHQFGIRYKALMERYQHVVRFSSFGHTHDESIYITEAINTTQPIGFNFVSASGTSGGDRNPAFTMVEFDAEYMVPLNVHTYYMNLTEANAGNDTKPVWKELHDMLKEYDLEDLSPSSMKNFTERLYNDADLASQYDWNQHTRGGSPSTKPNTPVHQQRFRCLQASEGFELKDCEGVQHIKLRSTDTTDWFNFLIGDWISIIS